MGRATRRLRGGFEGPLVTVVLPVSDEETTRIGPCLDTLRGQTHRNLDIVVVPYGRHQRVADIVRVHAFQDWRIRLLRRAHTTLAAARNAGVLAARGELVVVACGGDDFLPGSIAALVAAHRLSGSPLVVGRIKESDTVGWVADSPYDAAHHVDARRTSLTDSPVAITDLALGNKLFTRALWQASGLQFTAALPSGADVAVGLLQHASAFDLLREFTYVPTGRKDGVGVGTMPDILAGLDAWIDEHERTWRIVEALGDQQVRDWWLWGVLDAAVQPLIADVERADDHQWTTLRDLVNLLLDAADTATWAHLGAESRVKLWLIQHDHRDELATYAAARLFTAGSKPTTVREGRVFAQLPFHDDEGLAVPADLFEMSERETRLDATLRDVRWVGEDAIELTIAAAIEFVHMTELPTLECRLVDPQTGDVVVLPVRQERDLRANLGPQLAASRYQDRSWGVFTATVAVPQLVAASAAAGPEERGRTWDLDLTLTVDGVTRSGPITRIEPQGSAGFLGRDHLAPRYAAGAVVGFNPRASLAGLRVRPDDGPRLREVSVRGRAVSGSVAAAGTSVVAVRAAMGSLRVRGAVTEGADGTADFRLELPAPRTGLRRWELAALGADGTERPLGWPALDAQWLGVGGGDVVASRTAEGTAELLEAAMLLAVDDLVVDDLDVTLTGRWLAARPPTGVRIELVGQKATVTGALDPGAPAGQVRARFRLVQDAWGLGEAPLPHGIYPVTVTAGGASQIAPFGEALVDRLQEFTVGPSYTSRVMRFGRDCNLELQRSLADDERGPYAQRSLQDWYAATDFPLEQDAVYLQSYVGASATDSQLAIHAELRRARPDLRIHWGVQGASSWVPEGGIPVVMNSREWYRVLGSSAYLCLNIDPERWFTRKPGQQVLQTFHGYPAKSMGLRMWRAKHFTPRRIDLELARTSGEWDLILTPSPAMDEHYRREYAYDGPIHSHGYPRDDELVGDDADALRQQTRERLGIRPGQRAVLYAPTWRDDLATNWRAAEMVQHLDLEAASRALGPDYVLLMRGHRFHSNLTSPLDVTTAQFLDVTDYPEINHLILAADAAVLDYSSLRFDFALTGRPMIFLVPDLDSYVGGVRGFLYDYRESAPGPLVDTADEAVRLLRDFDHLERRCAPELARFNERFNHLQDGQSARHVVAAFFGRDAGASSL